MAERSTLITQDEYNALSDTDKALYSAPEQWSRGIKGGRAMLKSKQDKVKSTIPTAEMKQADPKTSSKTVLSREEANKSGVAPYKLPTEADVKKGASDRNGYIDAKGNVHLNSMLAEQRSAAAQEDLEQGRDYKTAKAPSQYELDLRNGKFDSKNTDGSYTYSYKELVSMRDKYRAAGDQVWKKIQEEINRRPEGQAEIAANKKKAEDKVKAEAKAKADAEAKANANKGTKSDGSEPALKDTRAEDEALDKKQEALDKVLDKSKTRREDLDEEWDKLLADSEAELDKHKDAADLADFLPRFAIQHYLEGNFGEKGSAKAIGTLGYFLLDKIGASLVNASQVARGMSPTQKTALEQYNTKMMEAAINRDDKNRTKINEEKVNTIIKNSDALRQAGYDTEVTLGNDMASKYLSQHADQIDEQVYLKLKKQAADWYDKLSDSEKMSVDRLFLAMSTNPSERQKGILQYQLKGYEANAQEDTARAEVAKYQQAEAKAKTKVVDKLTKAQLNRAETEIENMKKSGLLTDAQAADAWKMVDLHQKDLDWRDAQEWQKQITGYVNAAGGVVDAIVPDTIF